GQQAGPSPTSTLPDPSVSDLPADQDGGDPNDGELIDETSDPGQEFDPEQAGPAFQPRPNGLGDRTIRNEPQGPPLNTPKPPAPPSNPSPPPTTAPPRLAPPTTTP